MKVLNESTRAALPGEFTNLTDGVVHYEIDGPENGPWVVLVHGLSTPMFAWDPTCNALVENGYRVLRYDLFGRGYSDRPKTSYNLDLFVRQLDDLLHAVGIKEKVNLVGWSMGAAISASFVDRYPDRVDKITFIAPAGFPVNMPTAAKLLTIPLLGRILMAIAGEKSLMKSIEGLFHDSKFAPDYMEKFKKQMEYKGFLRAIHSTICHFPFDMADSFKQIGKQNRSTLLIWGVLDEITPFSNHTLVKEAIPDIEELFVSETKHAVHYEKPEIVNQKLIAFLNA